MILTEKELAIIDTRAHLGERRLDNGTHLIGHIPHHAPQAYLHTLFSPATPGLIAKAKSTIFAKEAFDRFIPFLSQYNGADFFLGSLALNGIRFGPLSRSSDERQPFDLLELNSFERPKNADPKDLFIGSYNEDGSLIYMKPDGRVYACKRNDAIPYSYWPNLAEMVSAELSRLDKLFDSDGRVLGNASIDQLKHWA